MKDSILFAFIALFMLAITFISTNNTSKCIVEYQHTANGIDYYSITNYNKSVGVDYVTRDELECYLKTGTFNYDISCLDCYNNAVFINF